MKLSVFISILFLVNSLFGESTVVRHQSKKMVSSDSAVIISPKHHTILNQGSVEYTISPACEVREVLLYVNYYPFKTDTIDYVTKAPFSAQWSTASIPDQDQLHLQFGYILYHVNGDTITSPPQPHHWIIDRTIKKSTKRYLCKQARSNDEICIDGKLDEWKRFRSENSPLGGGFKCSWTGSNFFLAVEVYDPFVTVADRLEISFDLTHSQTRFFDINHRIISFAPKSRSFSWAIDISDTGYTQLDSIIIRIDEEMEWRGSLTDYGYIIEARIPFCVLSALEFPQKRFGFDLSVIDINNTNQKEPDVYTWSGAQPSGRHNPNEWGAIILRQHFFPLKLLLILSLFIVAILIITMISLILYRKQKELFYKKVEKKELSPILKEIMHIIENNIEKQELNPKYISNKYGCSVSEVEKTFSQELGTSCAKVIRFSRIKKAKLYLLIPDFKIENSAHAVGFADTNVFVKAFKEFAGVTPEVWRRNRLEDSLENDGDTDKNIS